MFMQFGSEKIIHKNQYGITESHLKMPLHTPKLYYAHIGINQVFYGNTFNTSEIAKNVYCAYPIEEKEYF